MTEDALENIRGYIRQAFGSMGIVTGEVYLTQSDGPTAVDCHGIDPDDVRKAAERLQNNLVHDGWRLEAWYDEEAKAVYVDYV